MGEKRMHTCMCDWVTLLYSRKLTERRKPAIKEKNKNKNVQIKKTQRCGERILTKETSLGCSHSRVIDFK